MNKLLTEITALTLFLTMQCLLTRNPFYMMSGAIIGDGDRKSWDPHGPMIWDNFSNFRTNCAILASYIHAPVVVSRVVVVTLRDQILRIASFSCGFFTAVAGNKEPGLFYVLLCSQLMERCVFRVENFFNSPL